MPSLLVIFFLGAFLFAVIAVVVCIIFLILKMLSTQTRATGSTPRTPKLFHSRRYFFSKGETAFYRVLAMAVQNKYILMSKVRLADIISARSESTRTWATGFNRIKSKHIDFVLLNPADLTIALVIELDDKSHLLDHRKSRDAFINQCLTEAAIPILNIQARATYSLQNLLNQITMRLSLSPRRCSSSASHHDCGN